MAKAVRDCGEALQNFCVALEALSHSLSRLSEQRSHGTNKNTNSHPLPNMALFANIEVVRAIAIAAADDVEENVVPNLNSRVAKRPQLPADALDVAAGVVMAVLRDTCFDVAEAVDRNLVPHALMAYQHQQEAELVKEEERRTAMEEGAKGGKYLPQGMEEGGEVGDVDVDDDDDDDELEEVRTAAGNIPLRNAKGEGSVCCAPSSWQKGKQMPQPTSLRNGEQHANLNLTDELGRTQNLGQKGEKQKGQEEDVEDSFDGHALG